MRALDDRPGVYSARYASENATDEENVAKLLEVLHELVDQGNSVIVIEHNLDVVKTADWIIDIGPEGGDGGGQIVATGTPEEVAEVAESYTGTYLKSMLQHQGKVAAE